MDACPICIGTGIDPDAPKRVTPKSAPCRSVLTLVRPCGVCEGQGVITTRDRDLTKPSVSDRLQDAGSTLGGMYRRQLQRA